MSPGRGAPTFEEAVTAHAADLFRYAYWLARNRQQAEDIVQEALLRGWRAYPQVRDPAAAKAWLYSIVRNEFLRAAAREGRHAADVDIDELEIADERTGPFALEMRDALSALPVAYAEPLALQIIGGFSCAEIAEQLQTTQGAVMTRLTRARQALKRLVQPGGARERKGERS